jgi:hypothetical protein
MKSGLHDDANFSQATAAIRDRSLVLLLFAVFFIVGLMLGWRSLNYYWFSDDLHVIRLFSNEELARAFTGNWDVSSNIESPGYRPLLVLFNHLTSVIFGNNLAAHRIFRIALFAAFLAVFGLVARRLVWPHGKW